jgi:hypothetical protein
LELTPLEDPIFFFKKVGVTFGSSPLQLVAVTIARDPRPFRIGQPKVGFYSASRLRPLALLRLIMRLPCLVDILFLKPWVRARFILLG